MLTEAFFSEIHWFSKHFSYGLYAICKIQNKEYSYTSAFRKKYCGRQTLHTKTNFYVEKNAYHNVWLPVDF